MGQWRQRIFRRQERTMTYDTQPSVPGWEQIVSEQSARVFRLAYRLTGNQHDAEDLTQDVFVKVFRSLAKFQPEIGRASCRDIMESREVAGLRNKEESKETRI